MADSLVINGTIELLAGGVASTQPQCEGAFFRLGKEFDLGAPDMQSTKVAGLLLDGEQITTLRAGNRTITLPVVIIVPSTGTDPGDNQIDRLTLSGARELLLQSAAQERWVLVWTRDGGLPLTFDCQGLGGITVQHSLIYHRNLISIVEIEFEALPYGRSDDAELIVFPAPSQIWDQPPASVTIDAMTTPSSFLTGDASGFEGGIANWIGAGSCTVAQSALQAHTGTKSLAVTATAAATMTAGSCNPANIADDGLGNLGQGMHVNPGDTVNVTVWFRANSTIRTCQSGAEFFDSSGTSLGDGLFGTGVSDSAAAWTQINSGNLTAPAGSAYCRVKARVTTPANGEIHFIDDVTLNRGAVYSADDPGNWSVSSITAVSGQNSAKWSRKQHDAPIYDHTLPAAVDITGRAKFTFWLGLATTSTGYAHWHKGTATVSIILYDAQSDVVEFGLKQVKVVASALSNKPHWQKLSMHIPQDIPGFDYTTVSRYSIQVWNMWDDTVPQPALQASAYFCSITAAATATGTPVTRGSFYELPGVIGSARAPVGVQLQPGLSSFSSVAEFTTAGSNNWTSPVGVTNIDKVECWGAGAGGGGRNSTADDGGGGGGGGGYTMKRNVAVTASTLYHPVVGAAGTGGSSGNPGTIGGDSWFPGNSVTPRANGGHPGWAGVTQGGGKGGAEDPSGDLSYAGGDGWPSNASHRTPFGAIYGDNFGGGGGGSAGTGANGKDGSSSDRQGAASVTGGGPGGDGGQWNGSPNNGASPPTGPGGGGGGASHIAGSSGAAGKAGKVRLTWGASGILPLASSLVHVPGRDAPPALSPIVTMGTGTDVPNGGTDYTVPAVGNLAARFDGSYTVMLINNTWNTPGSSRTITVTLKQFAFSGGSSFTQALVRTVTPNSDVVNGYVEMGVITLPLSEISPGNTDSYFALSVSDTNTSDRFYDVLFLDTAGQTILLNQLTGTYSAFANNIWLDVAELDRGLGGVFGSDTDRDRARSMLPYCDPASTRISGGPLSVIPGVHNRVLVYAQQGNPGLSMWYFPRWYEDRLS